VDPLKYVKDTVLPAYLPRRGSTLNVEAPTVEVAPLSVVEAAKWLMADVPAAVVVQSKEDDSMLLPKQTLQPATRKAFGLFRDPFDELQCAQDMWVSPDIRYVREAMYQTARHGGFLAVEGESGAGKSTLRRDLVNRLAENNDPVLIIEPYVLASGCAEGDC